MTDNSKQDDCLPEEARRRRDAAVAARRVLEVKSPGSPFGSGGSEPPLVDDLLTVADFIIGPPSLRTSQCEDRLGRVVQHLRQQLICHCDSNTRPERNCPRHGDGVARFLGVRLETVRVIAEGEDLPF